MRRESRRVSRVASSHNRGELRQEGQRVSRHYYDLHVMFHTETGDRALANRALGAECIRHARMFFDRPDFDLEAAARGSFALTPTDGMLDGLRRDYDAMVGMIIGAAPRFEDVLRSVTDIDDGLVRRSTPETA
jgi:hypothetical protein